MPTACSFSTPFSAVVVQGSGLVFPSHPSSRGSAQGFLDVRTFVDLETEEKDEEDMLRVWCMA